MKTPKKTQNVYIAIVVLAIVLLGAGWLYMSSLAPTLELKTDLPHYYGTDEPQIEVMLHNSKDAQSGKIVLEYPGNILALQEAANSDGVTMRETESGITFELAQEYFDTKNTLIATLKFERQASERGNVAIEFNREDSSIESLENSITIEKFMDAKFGFGVQPSRGSETEKGQENVGTFDSI